MSGTFLGDCISVPFPTRAGRGRVPECPQVLLWPHSTPLQIPLDHLTNEMEQQVEPHNDYFSTQFLLNFSVLGTHLITVESSVRDADGAVWRTGPRTTIFVKSLEDPYSQQLRLQQQQLPAQQPPQRTAYTRF